MKIQIFTISSNADQQIFDQNSLNDFLSTVLFRKSDVHFVDSDVPYGSVLVHFEDEEFKQNGTTKATSEMGNRILSFDEQMLERNLRQWRNKKAVEARISAFLVCCNSELSNVAIQKPKSSQELRQIKGFGELKVEKYGSEILTIVKTLCFESA